MQHIDTWYSTALNTRMKPAAFKNAIASLTILLYTWYHTGPLWWPWSLHCYLSKPLIYINSLHNNNVVPALSYKLQSTTLYRNERNVWIQYQSTNAIILFGTFIIIRYKPWYVICSPYCIVYPEVLIVRYTTILAPFLVRCRAIMG